MKLATELLVITCYSLIVVHRSSSTETGSNEQILLLERASAQLERLAPYRRTVEQIVTDPSTEQTRPDKEKISEPAGNYGEQQVALEIVQLAPEDLPGELDEAKKQEINRVLVDILSDPKYVAMMQERIKRGSEGGGYGYGGGYGGGGDSGSATGSASIISGIASGILGGLTSASKGSSAPKQHASYTAYGPPHTHDDKKFDVWDFKKAIFNTLFQAIKAISGGVIALKGHLIKGSGFLVSAKGRVISSSGEAITSLGRHIASSAVLTPPKTYYAHAGYSYDPPHSANVGYDTAYDGPPPSADTFDGHYAMPSDDDDRAGLLIIKPTKPEHEHHEHHEHHEDHNHDHQPHADVGPNDHQHVGSLEESFGGPQNGYHVEGVLSSVPANEDDHQDHQENHLDSHPNLDVKPPQNYETPSAHYDFGLNQGNKDHQLSDQPYPSTHLEDTYHLDSIKPHIPSFGNINVQQSVEYPPIHLEQIQYTSPEKNPSYIAAFPPFSKLPESLSNIKGVPHYTSPGLVPHVEPLKLGTHLDSYPQANLLGSKYQQQQIPTFHGLSAHSGIGHPIGASSSSQEPLKIPILNSLPTDYWRAVGGMRYGSYGMHPSFISSRSNTVTQPRHHRRWTSKDVATRHATLGLRDAKLHRV